LESKTTIHDTGDVSRGVREQVQPAARTVGIILRNAAVITDETAKASTAQKEYWKTASEKTSGLIAETQTTVDKYGDLADTAKGQLPGSFGKLNGALDDAGNTLRVAGQQLATIGPVMTSAKALVDDVDAGLKNPELAAARKSAARILAAWAAGSEDVQKKLHGSLFPAQKNHFNLVMDGVRLAGPIGEVLYDFTNIHR
jgi:ABC-type transporter Mla subunit MlaD